MAGVVGDDEFGDEISVTPLAIPMITGPGAITMVLIMMQGAESPLGCGTGTSAMSTTVPELEACTLAPT